VSVSLPERIAAQLPPGARDREVAVDGQHVHVMEWGPPDGRAVVLLHGNPTWAFLWRKVIAAIRARPGGGALRLIAPDLVGLGRSSRPPATSHTLLHHAAWIGATLDVVVPGPLVLVAQDWGGPIGLAAMLARAPRLRGLVLGNTAISPPAPGFRPTTFHRLAHAPVLGDVLFRQLGFPLGVLHRAQGDRHSIRGDVAHAYRWPLRRRHERTAPLALARMVPNSHAHPSVATLARTEALYRDAAIPVTLVWGMRDPILGRVVNHLARVRPDARVIRTDAGHFLQEEVPDHLADAVLDVVERADWS